MESEFESIMKAFEIVISGLVEQEVCEYLTQVPGLFEYRVLGYGERNDCPSYLVIGTYEGIIRMLLIYLQDDAFEELCEWCGKIKPTTIE